MMRLLYTPIERYVHTVEVLINYAGLRDRIEPVPTKPFGDEAALLAVNPLGKVPCLDLGGGEYLGGGPVIYEYLDSLHDQAPLYPTGEPRWGCLRRVWLADGLFDVFVTLVIESWLPADQQRPDYVERQSTKVNAMLTRIAEDAKHAPGLDMGTFRTIGALEFLQLKWTDVSTALGHGATSFDWRAQYPSMASAYAGVAASPWFQMPLK